MIAKSSINASLGGYAIFAEDIRQEVGGRFTVVGANFDKIIAPAVPGIIPKLAILVEVRESSSTPYQPVTVKAFLPGDSEDAPTLEMALVDPADGTVSVTDTEPEFDHTAGVYPADTTIRRRIAIMMLSPCRLVHEGEIRVRAFRGDEVFALGACRVVKEARRHATSD